MHASTSVPLLRLCLLLTAVCGSTISNAQSLAYVEFDPRFLGNNSKTNIDLSRFSYGNQLEPGIHHYDVYINDVWLGRQDLNVKAGKDTRSSYQCFTPAQIDTWSLNINALPDSTAFREQLATNDCIDVSNLIPEFSAVPLVSELTLRINIPQAYISRHAKGYIDPSNWQQGVAGAFINYNLSAFRNKYRDYDNQNNYFGSINAGFNVDAWRFRYNGSYSHDSNFGNRYQSLSTYAQRDVIPLQSQLTIGQAYTQSTIFNSIPYTGIQINSDDRMLPDSLAGFAPVIQGVADTNAKVSVFQGTNQIYEISVPPGPFSINDLYNTGYSGDLEVVITESNGQTKRFTVPYATVPQLLRPGLSRYALTAGRYRDKHMSSLPMFLQGTYQRGMTNLVSGYGGVIAAENYYSGQLGLALNTTVGALAFDVTQSYANNLPDGWLKSSNSSSGQSYRLGFNKLVPATNTNIALAAYRFSESGYMTFTEFVRARNPRDTLTIQEQYGQWGEGAYYANNYLPQKHRFQLSINQHLGNYGSLYVSGATQNYWNKRQGTSTTYQVGYNKGFNWGSMNVNVSRFTTMASSSSTQVMVSFNVPLGRQNAPTLSTSITRADHGNSAYTANLHGSTGDRRQLSYGIFNTYQDQNSQSYNNVGGSLQYDGHSAQASVAHSNSNRGTNQTSLNLNGSIIAHSGGINFTRNQGDTFAILHAPGAGGSTINGNNGSLINASGYGVAPNLIPYRNNSVSIDPNGSSLDVEVMGSVKNVAPTAGAIVKVQYETRQGRATLLSVRMADGLAPPMGADVRYADQSVALVGQDGRIFLRGVEGPTELLVSWGNDISSQCKILYTPTEEIDSNLPFSRQSVRCTEL